MRRIDALTTATLLAVMAVAPSQLQAHRQWMLPSSTVLSGSEPWVTVDAAVSNELFYFDHVPMRTTGLVITAPDGSTVQPENAATGKYRSTFDVHLTQLGTYKIANVNNTVFATWDDNGSAKNWRGTADAFAKEVPKDAKDLKTSRMSSRVEIFVTSGKPTAKALAPTGIGLEMVPVTHPNDLAAGSPATFQFLMDGKPAANLEVTMIPGGIRYRDELHDVKATTDAEGKVTFSPKESGMYWINATSGGGRPGGAGGPGGGPVSGRPRPERGPETTGWSGGQGAAPSRPPMRMPMGSRANYAATVEVLP